MAEIGPNLAIVLGLAVTWVAGRFFATLLGWA